MSDWDAHFNDSRRERACSRAYVTGEGLLQSVLGAYRRAPVSWNAYRSKSGSNNTMAPESPGNLGWEITSRGTISLIH